MQLFPKLWLLLPLLWLTLYSSQASSFSHEKITTAHTIESGTKDSARRTRINEKKLEEAIMRQEEMAMCDHTKPTCLQKVLTFLGFSSKFTARKKTPKKSVKKTPKKTPKKAPKKSVKKASKKTPKKM